MTVELGAPIEDLYPLPKTPVTIAGLLVERLRAPPTHANARGFAGPSG